VHVIGAGPQSAYLAALHRLLRAHLVFTAQGELAFDAQDVFTRSSSLRAGLRRMLRVADAVTACSEYVLRELTAFAPIRAPACVVPNGVEPADFADATPASRNRPYVLGVGRLVPQKGFDVLLDACASPRLAGLDLVVAGDGRERARLSDRAATLGLAERVELTGALGRRALAQLLAGARAFALTSRAEPFGIALLEAMAAGVPAVATRAGGVPEFARDEHNALLVPPDDSTELAAALERLDADAALRVRLVEGGRRTANELSWERIADRYLEVYQP
jgi:glycosyltransferase involved in cell wall biosynthesis